MAVAGAPRPSGRVAAVATCRARAGRTRTGPAASRPRLADSAASAPLRLDAGTLARATAGLARAPTLAQAIRQQWARAPASSPQALDRRIAQARKPDCLAPDSESASPIIATIGLAFTALKGGCAGQ